MKLWTYQKRRKVRRAISLALVATFLVTLPRHASISFATSIDQQMREEQEKIDNAGDNIDAAQSAIDKLNAKIEENKKKFYTCVANQEVLAEEIEQKTEEIEKAAQELELAEATVAKEYDDMKLRIQFMYENSTENSFWAAILSSNGLADMLTRVEYLNDVYQSDRQLMKQFKNHVAQIEALQEQLNADMEELLAKQEEYEQQQKELENLIASMRQERGNYEDQIAKYEKSKQKHEETLSALAEEKRRREAAAAAANAATYEGGGTGEANSLGNAEYLTDPSYNPTPVTSTSGSDIVNYALQFVGNRYVWGGNSLTEGCDCSGFVHLIMKHFGIASPRYSQSFKSVGQPVAYDNIQPGDVVVYAGHVAIYAGGGVIVEAQSTKAGITSGRSVNCHKITAIRRLN